ncbi:hypothetical protein N9425_02625 [Gammaproteobacteria bacterium]|nr:hypothetical protein [Gammaproteobacteria bacterium]
MYKDRRILAVVPARAHYDKIDELNLKKLGGNPLISYTLQATQKSKYLDKVIVSTEDSFIADIADSYGASVPFLRPEKLVKLGITTAQVAKHVIESISDEFDIVIILLPNAPFRTSEIIDDAIEFMIKNEFQKVRGVTEKTDYFLCEKEDTFVTLNSELNIEDNTFISLFTVGGGIYLYERDQLFKDNDCDESYGNFVINEHNARLIRSLYDLLIAERLIKLNQSLVDSLINST